VVGPTQVPTLPKPFVAEQIARAVRDTLDAPLQVA
jgi:hypothetical protein